MYFTIKNKEDQNLIQEYLLTKSTTIYKLNHDELDRIFYYKSEKLYLLFTKNIFERPNVRRTYLWFENEIDLNMFITKIKNTTIKKYENNYFELYKEFDEKLTNFKNGDMFKNLNTKNIEEQKSLTFTYYNLQKFSGIFYAKFDYLLNWNSDILSKFDIYEEECKLIKYDNPEDYINNFLII